MRLILVLFTLLLFNKLHSQTVPSDGLILKKIYGKVDKSKKSYTRPFNDGEGEYSYNDSLRYRIAFRANIKLEGQLYLLALIEAPNSNQHGHSFGYRELYFFTPKQKDWVLAGSIIPEGEEPLGDSSHYEIVDIGKNKKALISAFQSTGNQHFEYNESLSLISKWKLSYLTTINSLYDNSAWKTTETENDTCEARSYQESSKIIVSDKEWYDIKVHVIEPGFTKGCENTYIKKEYDLIYHYKDGKYIEKSVKK